VFSTNGEIQPYATFAQGHERVYRTAVRYGVRYDDVSWVESPNRVAVRVRSSVERPGEVAMKFEVVLIALDEQTTIFRLCTVTWPDWRQADAFKSGSSHSGELSGQS
jgi:hypothetical protein